MKNEQKYTFMDEKSYDIEILDGRHISRYVRIQVFSSAKSHRNLLYFVFLFLLCTYLIFIK